MACCQNNCNGVLATTTLRNSRVDTSTNNNNNNTDTIAGLLRRIDELQRNAICNNAVTACDNCFVTPMFNTKPINIYCGCTQFFVTFEGVEYSLFRVEEVRGNETVVLRLLDTTGEDITCTTETFILRIDCICGIKCNPAINCTLSCFQATTTA